MSPLVTFSRNQNRRELSTIADETKHLYSLVADTISQRQEKKRQDNIHLQARLQIAQNENLKIKKIRRLKELEKCKI